ESFRKDVDDKFENLQKEIVEIKIGQVKLESELKGDIKALENELKGDIKALETEVKGIGKRLDTQEFINRSVVVGFVLALAAGAVKLFFPSFPH
ncbi:MAG: Bdr protein, partial [Symploca sp. SIO2G7]|nr:Bdr protein [Symploca sp. SIO2G7]